ncbi:MAG: dockerin type I repeat-containing protein [Acutalibacteraceae bacterium]
MKQSKRLLCVLIAMVMMLSCFTVGVSAYKTSYTTCEYSSVKKPVFTKEQAGSALLDYLDDEVFAGLDVNFDLSILSLHIHIYSLDSLFDSVKDIVNHTLYKTFNFGDIEKMNFSVPKNSDIRRTSKNMTDLQVFGYFLQFLQQNASPLYKLADNSLDLGIIDNFFNMREKVPMLNDLHGYINEMVYKALFDPDGVGFEVGGYYDNLDNMLNEFINNRLIKFVGDMLAKSDGTNAFADFLGLATNEDGTLKDYIALVDLLPSLKTSIGNYVDITSVGTYDLIESIFDALIDDIVVKFAGELILDALKIDPEDTTADTSYINIAIGLFVTNESMGLPEDAAQEEMIAKFLESQGVENPTAPKPIDKINVTLKYILKEGLTQYIYFQDDGNGGKYLTLEPTFVSKLADYVKTLLPIIGSVWKDAPELSNEELDALDTMNDEQTFAFLLKFLLEALVDGVEFSENCNSIRELATFTLLDVLKDLYPDVEFEDLMAPKDENGNYIGSQYNPSTDWCLDLAAALIDYYLVGEFGMETVNSDPTQITFDAELNAAFDFFLTKYAKLFNLGSYANSTDIWAKAYYSINQVIPLTNICYGVENSKDGLREIVMDKLINPILNFDINTVLSLIGRRASTPTLTASLDKPLTQIVTNLLARVINGVFQLPHYETAGTTDNAAQLALIIPYSYTKLDQITTNINTDGVNNGTGLKNTVKMLLSYLTNITGAGSLCDTSLDLIAELIGVIDVDTYDYVTVDYNTNHPTGETYSISELRTIYDELALTGNEGLQYYDDNYEYFHMVDFAPWAYLAFKSTLSKAGGLLSQYDAAKEGNGEFPTRSDITFYCYSLRVYKDLLLGNQTYKSTYQLNKVLAPLGTVQYTDNLNPDGTKKYTDRTWNAYWNAYQFAVKVMNEYQQHVNAGTVMDYRQSKINTARRQLSKTYNALKDYIGLADYTQLDGQIDRVANLFPPSRYTSESVQDVVDAYKDARSLDRDYDQDSQKLVDNFYKRLYNAIEKLVSIPSIEFYNYGDNTYNQNIDERYNYAIGFDETFWTELDQSDFGGLDGFQDYFSIYYGYSGDGDIRLSPTKHGAGTGSKLQIVEDPFGEAILKNEYTLVMFGDVNGDGKIDGQDAVVLKAYASLMLDPELTAAYITYAGDLNFDGNIGNSDVKSVENAGVGREKINQAPSECIGKYVSFVDLANGVTA